MNLRSRVHLVMAVGVVAGWFSAIDAVPLPAHGSCPTRIQTPLAAGKVERSRSFTGIVHTGVMAIGGESTGVILEMKTGKYELDVEGDQKLAVELEALDGKRATITGDYEKRAGVEVKERHVIVVRKIEPASRGNQGPDCVSPRVSRKGGHTSCAEPATAGLGLGAANSSGG